MGIDYAGKWENQLGATMTLTVHENGWVEGTFKSPKAENPAPLSGFVKNGVIVFSNAFDTGMGTMLGQPLDDDATSSFQTWWHFREFDDPRAKEDKDKPWFSVRTGCDTFTRAK